MRDWTDHVCCQPAAHIRHDAMAYAAAYLCSKRYSSDYLLDDPAVLRRILRTRGSRGDCPGGQGFIYISEDLSVRYDEPFSKTAVPDRNPSGAGGLVSIGAAFKGRLWRI